MTSWKAYNRTMEIVIFRELNSRPKEKGDKYVEGLRAKLPRRNDGSR